MLYHQETSFSCSTSDMSTFVSVHHHQHSPFPVASASVIARSLSCFSCFNSLSCFQNWSDFLFFLTAFYLLAYENSFFIWTSQNPSYLLLDVNWWTSPICLFTIMFFVRTWNWWKFKMAILGSICLLSWHWSRVCIYGLVKV